MSWKANLSRHLHGLRFFACPESPSSTGVMKWYTKHYAELCHLNPNMGFLMRTTHNAMPAVVAEINYKMHHLLHFMIQTGRFRDLDGSISKARVEAAQAYLDTDQNQKLIERFKMPGFDPEKPFLDETDPKWREDPEKKEKLAGFLAMKKDEVDQEATFKSGPDNEFEKAAFALTMTQRVDLWCAGEKEVEAAVVHLYKLGRQVNSYEPDMPFFIENYFPGCDDMVN